MILSEFPLGATSIQDLFNNQLRRHFMLKIKEMVIRIKSLK